MDVQTSLLGLEVPGGKTMSQSLIKSEIPLPDGRDAAAVLSVHARAGMESAVCADGCIQAEGRLELYCVCRALSGDIYGFSATSMFTHELRMDGVTSAMHAEVTSQVLECTAVPDALRLKLNAVLELSALVLSPVQTPFVTDVVGATGLEMKKSRLTVSRKAQLAENTLRIREESDAPNVARILMYRGETEITELSFSGASVCQAQGKLIVTALVETEGGELNSLILRLPFTCSFDAAYQQNIWVEASLVSLSVIAADVSFGVVDTEAVVKLRLLGVETAGYDLLQDAYAFDASCTCRQREVQPMMCVGSAQKTFQITENVLIPESTDGIALPDALRPVCAFAMPAVTGLFERDGQLGADVMLLTSILYRSDDGKIHGFTEDIPVQLHFDSPFTPDALISVSPLCTEAAGGGRTLSVTYTLSALAVLYDTSSTQLVEELAPGGEACPYAGILIYSPGRNETAWDVGKRFLVPIDTLSAWNGQLPEPLKEGQPVVLVK